MSSEEKLVDETISVNTFMRRFQPILQTLRQNSEQVGFLHIFEKYEPIYIHIYNSLLRNHIRGRIPIKNVYILQIELYHIQFMMNLFIIDSTQSKRTKMIQNIHIQVPVIRNLYHDYLDLLSKRIHLIQDQSVRKDFLYKMDRISSMDVKFIDLVRLFQSFQERVEDYLQKHEHASHSHNLLRLTSGLLYELYQLDESMIIKPLFDKIEQELIQIQNEISAINDEQKLNQIAWHIENTTLQIALMTYIAHYNVYQKHFKEDGEERNKLFKQFLEFLQQIVRKYNYYIDIQTDHPFDMIYLMDIVLFVITSLNPHIGATPKTSSITVESPIHQEYMFTLDTELPADLSQFIDQLNSSEWVDEMDEMDGVIDMDEIYFDQFMEEEKQYSPPSSHSQS